VAGDDDVKRERLATMFKPYAKVKQIDEERRGSTRLTVESLTKRG
jgi:hypothetical protein